MRIFLSALLIVMMFLIACSTADPTPTTEPAATAVPSTPIPTTVVPTPTTPAENLYKPIVSTATPTPTATPVAIVDALGQQLSFETSPSRIVTLSPTATEMLYLVGGEAVGRDRASNYPEAALELPDVGSGYNPSIETLIGMKPDLVIIEALTQARFAPTLAASGITVMAVKIESVEDIYANVTMIGEVIGKQDAATAAITSIKTRLATITSEDKSILLLISDADQNLYAAKPESYTGLIANVLGMENKAAGLPDAGPFPGFTLMTTEAILIANPDVIVTITPAPEPAPRLSQSLRFIPPFAGLKAIQQNAVIEGDLALFLQAPGPRLVDAVEALKNGITG